MQIKFNELAGRTVLDANGCLIGRIKVPMVEMETWLVDTLRVSVARRAAGELDLAWPFWRRPTIDVPTGLVHAAGDAIILRVSLAELRETPPPPTPVAAFPATH
jgi:sporulation protein YlmC with PRC-barrel domain